MATAFADLEARVNAACFVHLGNASALFTIDGVTASGPVDVVFDEASAIETSVGVIGDEPSLMVDPSLVEGIGPGDSVVIRSTTYSVRAAPRLAEGGMRRLILARS